MSPVHDYLIHWEACKGETAQRKHDSDASVCGSVLCQIFTRLPLPLPASSIDVGTVAETICLFQRVHQCGRDRKKKKEVVGRQKHVLG
jgi:hypothetical protein